MEQAPRTSSRLRLLSKSATLAATGLASAVDTFAINAAAAALTSAPTALACAARPLSASTVLSAVPVAVWQVRPSVAQLMHLVVAGLVPRAVRMDVKARRMEWLRVVC